jgi:hypothetical protein
MRTGAIMIAVITAVASEGTLTSCSTVPSDLRIGVDSPDGTEAGFGPVGDYLDHRCGSLDCHGNIARNLRIWGCEGMRLDPNDTPQCDRRLGGHATTPAEHQATYRSLVGLEPAVMSFVVEGHGQHPELLTFVRKSRGIESHKGGTLITPGDYQDQCVTDWLAGQTTNQMYRQVCGMAIGFPMFPSADASAE